MTELKNMFIQGTKKTPQVDFNQSTGELVLYGKSIPEDASKVYKPMLTWITDYIKSPCRTTNLRLNLDYFNSASMLWLVKMIKAIGKINDDDYILFIHLYFDIEDFESMDMEELRDVIAPLVDNIGEVKISIGVKTHGTDSQGKAIKESTIFV